MVLSKKSVPKFTFQATVSRINRKISQNQWLRQRELAQNSQRDFRELQRGQENVKQKEEQSVHGLQLQRELDLMDLYSHGTKSTGVARNIINQEVPNYEVL